MFPGTVWPQLSQQIYSWVVSPALLGSFSVHPSFEEASREKLSGLCLTWHAPNCLQFCLSASHSPSAGEPILACQAKLAQGGSIFLHLILAAFPHSGYHRLKEGAVPTIFESFSKLRRTTKTKGHSYPPGPHDVSRLRRCRKRYVLSVGSCPTPIPSLREWALGSLPAT